ncbi:MAG: hypothetical protein KDI16_05210 [Halioglobus sp.]|nr:hypothetical protein [Halioglobus sp.]
MTLLSSTKQPFSAARWLALLALLCAVSLQAAEAAHQHGTGEPTAHCLLCKSAGNAVAVAVAPGLPSVVAAARATVACTRASTSHAHFSPRLTRGPPTLLN